MESFKVGRVKLLIIRQKLAGDKAFRTIVMKTFSCSCCQVALISNDSCTFLSNKCVRFVKDYFFRKKIQSIYQERLNMP